MNKPAYYQKGSALILGVVIVVAIVIGAVVIVLSGGKPGSLNIVSNPVPTNELKVNPKPMSPNNVYVGEVGPGNSVTVSSVELEEAGLVHVYTDNNGNPGKLLGKSRMLEAGTHTDVVINLSDSLKDGDVILVGLYDKSGKAIVDLNENPVQVQKNIGMPMSHYDLSEY